MIRFRKRKKIQDFKKTGTLLTPIKAEMLSSDLAKNEQIIKDQFQNCSDFVIRTFFVTGEAKILLIFIDGLVDTKILDEVLLKPMLFGGLPRGLGEEPLIGHVIERELVAFAQVHTTLEMSKLIEAVLKAQVGILIEGENRALIADLKGFEKRSIEEPATEVTIRGPRDGFIESIRTNTSLLRRRIRSTKLKLEAFTIGEFSQTDVAVAYIEGVASDSIIKEVRTRIDRIQIDGVLESEFIEEFIEDAPYSPFPQIQNTERPDVVASNLLEGKVAIFVDNTPFVLIIPMTFWSGLQAVEDYYERFIYATFVSGIRYILYFVSLFLPSLYVALTTYHPKLIPTNLLISIAAARDSVPFPAVIEALIMEFMFEGLREAGIRLPKPIGSAVSIVGALVIGQAAVQAGIVSAPMVIVVAMTGIASFAVPRYNLGTAFRIIRFAMLMLASFLGLYGIVFGMIVLTIHLVNLRSFGVPYFSPVAPQILGSLKDILIRAPRWSLHSRPALISGVNKKRIPSGQKPSPKRGGKGNE